MAKQIIGDGARVPAWQKLGTTFPEPVSAVEAADRAGLTYQVRKEPLSYGTDPVLVPGRFALVREQTAEDVERVVGFCGKAYEVLQHARVAELINGLTEEWPVDVAGATGAGETMFMTLNGGTASVKGDEIHNYFLVTNSTTGGRAVRVAYTPVRVASQAVLVTGLRAANLASSIPHLAGVQQEVAFRVNLLKQMRKAQEATLAVFEKMAATKVTDKQAQAVVAAAWPDPATPAKVQLLQQAKGLGVEEGLESLEKVQKTDVYRRERLEAFRAAALDIYQKFNETQSDLAYTAWALWTAIAECADYRQGAGETSVADSALWGPRAKEKVLGFQAAVKLVK